jgi:hypothetical protein
MATKDISRFLFQPKQHYSGVRMQQGRVLLDSDFNEEARLGDEERRLALVDVIGGKGSPDDGFMIGGSIPVPAPTPFPDQAPTLGHFDAIVATRQILFNGIATPGQDRYWMFSVLRGTIYVGGLRFVLDRPEHLAFQSDFLEMGRDINDLPSTDEAPVDPISLLFYLNGWEQCVSAIEDGEVLERALGGPDTSVRIRRMRRVQVFRSYSSDCDEAFEELAQALEAQNATLDRETGELKSDGRLQLDFIGGDAEETCAPCAPSPGGRYLGAENQAIRVMMTAENTFAWSFDNAAPVYKVKVTGLATATPSSGEVTVEMLTPPKDEEHWPLAGRVVEILPWGAILENGEKVAAEIGAFSRVVKSFDPTTKLLLLDNTVGLAAIQALVHRWDTAHPRATELNVETPATDERFFYLRVWHHSDDGSQVHLPATGGAGTTLGTTGITAIFHTPGRAGDYWTAALRPETPDIIVPFELRRNTDGVPPHGPRHFYTPLATTRARSDSETGSTPGEGFLDETTDCRVPIRPVTDRHCCTVTVGDGFHSFGDFRFISDAINRLGGGGRICVRPGIYPENIAFGPSNGNITIEGCGENTVIQGAITATNTGGIALRSFKLIGSITADGTSTDLLGVSDLVIEDPPGSLDADGALITVGGGGSGITIDAVAISAPRRSAIDVSGVADVRLRGLEITQPFGSLEVPVEAQVRLDTIDGLVFEKSSIGARGRTGVFLRAITRGRLDELDVRSEELSLEAGSKGAFQMEGIDSEFSGSVPSTEIEITNSRFAMGESFSLHAAVTLAMRDSRFSHNIVRAGTTAWGGIHVLDTSSGNEITHNLVEGGNGHGVTLGSVLWFDDLYFTAPTHREPVGQAQFELGDLRFGFQGTGDDPPHFSAIREAGNASIANTVISDNVIRDMGANGISVLTALGLPGSGNDIFRFSNIRIERNRIENCLLRLASATTAPNVEEPSIFPVGGSRFGTQPAFAALVQLLPFGGIVLAAADNAVIADNSIIGNGAGADFRQPVCGIFLLAAAASVISGNRIADNGVFIPREDTTPLFAGMRAGIAVMLSGPSVVTRGDIQNFFLSSNSVGLTQAGLDAHANRVNHREGRALYVVGAGAMSVEGNFLATEGFHGSDRDVDRFAMGDIVFIQNMGVPWEADPNPDFGALGTARNPPLLEEYLTNNPAVVSGFGLNLQDNLMRCSVGGHLLFHDNRAVLDWIVPRHVPNPSGPGTPAPLSYAPVALISLDHVSAKNNLLGLRVDPTFISPGDLDATPRHLPPVGSAEARFDPSLLLAHLFVLAGTVDVTKNRVSSNFRAVDVSILSIGMLANVSVFNQTSHCVVSYEPTTFETTVVGGESSVQPFMRAGDFHVTDGNQVLFAPPGSGGGTPPCEDYYLSVHDLVVDLVSLLYDQTT